MNIVLIGFMGVGKTSVGKLLSKKLNYNFVDTDKQIEDKVLMSVDEIFFKYGEKYFRKLEQEIVNQICELQTTVISTGGGIVLNDNNIKKLTQNGFIIWLQSSPEFILNNIKKQNNRPLLNNKQNIKEIKKLLNLREEKYKYCDYKIQVDELSIEQIAHKIIKKLKEKKVYGG